MQTYAEYLATMRAYNFHPMAKDLWVSWQLHHHNAYREDDGRIIAGDTVPHLKFKP